MQIFLHIQNNFRFIYIQRILFDHNTTNTRNFQSCNRFRKSKAITCLRVKFRFVSTRFKSIDLFVPSFDRYSKDGLGTSIRRQGLDKIGDRGLVCERSGGGGGGGGANQSQVGMCL